METSIPPEDSFLESFEVESSSSSSIKVQWHVQGAIVAFIDGFRVHHQKVASTYIQYGPKLLPTTTVYQIKNLVADTYYKVKYSFCHYHPSAQTDGYLDLSLHCGHKQLCCFVMTRNWNKRIWQRIDIPAEIIWASAWGLRQCGMCDQQSLRSACAYAQSDQSRR